MPVRCPLGGDGEGRGGDGSERLSLVAEQSSLGWRVPRPGGKGAPRRRPEVLGSTWGLGSHHALGAMGLPPATPRVVSGRVFRLHPTSLSLHSCRFLASVPSPCRALECGGLDGLPCVSGAFGGWKGKYRLIHRRVTHRWGSTCGNVHVRVFECL